MAEEIIRLENVCKNYGEDDVLHKINLSVRRNEFFTLLGPSGCGKTTMLRIIGGFETATEGSVYFDGAVINDLPPNKRRLNTVFQRYALFPHLDVFNNVAFGLKVKKLNNKEITPKVKEMLSLVGLKGFEKRDVTSLSGGQQQRVAIARALVNEPEVLLLDEPLGALDLKLRKDMQIELKKIQQRLGITFIYVTHDQEEALTMSDKIVVMRSGVIQQLGTPEDIYNEPTNAFVADFIGESNIIDGVMLKDKLVRFQNTDIPCVDGGFNQNEPVDVVVRPEDVEIIDSADNGGKAQFSATVKSSTFKGVHYEMLADCEGTEWMIHSTVTEPIGSRVGIYVKPSNIHIMRKSNV